MCCTVAVVLGMHRHSTMYSFKTENERLPRLDFSPENSVEMGDMEFERDITGTCCWRPLDPYPLVDGELAVA